MTYYYSTKGTCSRKIRFDIQDGRLKKVMFDGGCNGNAQGISRLVEGMPATEAVQRLKGIRCGSKGTSCPDQLAVAIEGALKDEIPREKGEWIWR